MYVCVCTCVCACVCLLNHKASVCKGTVYGWETLTRHCIYPQCKQVNPMYGFLKSLLNNSTCVCVHMRVCMCVLNHKVSMGSICKRTGYGKANQALLSRSIYPHCTQVNPMYGHQKSLLKNSTCVCECMCAC